MVATAVLGTDDAVGWSPCIARRTLVQLLAVLVLASPWTGPARWGDLWVGSARSHVTLAGWVVDDGNGGAAYCGNIVGLPWGGGTGACTVAVLGWDWAEAPGVRQDQWSGRRIGQWNFAGVWEGDSFRLRAAPVRWGAAAVLGR